MAAWIAPLLPITSLGTMSTREHNVTSSSLSNLMTEVHDNLNLIILQYIIYYFNINKFKY